MIRFLLLVFIFTIPVSGILGQLIEGYIYDDTSGEPLVGSSVSLYSDDEFMQGTITDEEGYFSLNVETSVDDIRISYLGFNEFNQLIDIENEEVINLSVFLERSSSIIAFPQITTKVSKIPNATLLTKSFFKRIPGAFDDPSRLLIRFPAISIANDGANQIVVKGLAPHMALWSANGAFIVNPNHLSNAGTLTDQASSSGGGTNMISGNSIGTFQFFSNPLNNNYFNGASGISNTTFSIPTGIRYSVGLLGTEISAVQRNNNDFYYGLNYRYSTLGILSALGVDLGDEAIYFQDLHVQLGKKWAYAKIEFNSIWGNNRNLHESLGAEFMNFKDMQRIDFNSSQWLNSLSYNYVKNRIRYNSALNYSTRNSSRISSVDPLFMEFTKDTDISFSERLISFVNALDYTLNSSFNLSANINLNRHQFDNGMDNSITSPSLYSYAGIKYSSEKYTGIAGAGISSFHNGGIYPEIRSSHQYVLNDKHKIKLAYSLQNHGIVPQLLLADEITLDPFNSHNLSFDYFINTDRSYWNIGAFYHQYSDVPVSVNNNVSYFDRLDLLMQNNGITDINNDGSATIYGLVGQWEMIRSDKWQIIAAGSWYDMTIEKDEIAVQSSYDFGYTGSASISYSIPFGLKKLILSSAFQSRGAQYHAVIDEQASENNLTTIFDLSQEKERVDNSYNRLDLKIDYIFGKNQKNTLSLDIQNVLNTKNFGYYYYDPVLQSIETQNQLGLIPIIKFSSKI